MTKILGFIPNIVLPRIIGAEGVGLFRMAFPVLLLVITLTTFGLPVAISKLVAEAEAKKDYNKIKSVLRISIFIVIGLSILFTILMFAFAPFISKYLLTDQRAYYPLLAITPIIPIIAISSVLRGYFQGRQNMTPSALSSLIETIVRILTVIFFALYMRPFGIEYAATAAMLGVVVGEFFGMLVLIYQFRRAKKRNLIPYTGSLFQKVKRNRIQLLEIGRIAIPVTTSRLAGNVFYVIEPVVVAQSLAYAGFSVATATSLYGELSGMAIPLVFIPTFLTYSLSVSLVPAISEAAAQKKYGLIQRRLSQSLRLTLVMCAPFAVTMYVFAVPVSTILYDQPQVGHLLQVLAPFSLFLYFQAPLAATLQGLDRAKEAMRNTIIGAAIKTIAIFLLASQPVFGIDGVAMAINVGIVLVTLFHFFSLVKLIGFTIEARTFVKVGIAMIIMGYSGSYFMTNWLDDWGLFLSLLAAVFVSILVYILLLVSMKVLGRQDVVRIPWIGEQLAPFFPKR
ncbi:stage V sporulation protein B [Microaerobacter geothermalis]|nr:stage V sporulation protein B [Microaerobacter geothermalis]